MLTHSNRVFPRLALGLWYCYSNWLKLIRDQGNKSHTNSDCLVPIVLCLKVCISDPPPHTFHDHLPRISRRFRCPDGRCGLACRCLHRKGCNVCEYWRPSPGWTPSCQSTWHGTPWLENHQSALRGQHIYQKNVGLAKIFFFLFLWRAQDMRFILKSYSFWFLRPFFLTFFFLTYPEYFCHICFIKPLCHFLNVLLESENFYY